MKILFITNQFYPPRNTGSAISSHLIYKGLREGGHDIDLIIHDQEKFKHLYERTEFGTYFAGRKLSYFKSNYPWLSDGDYDIIHQYGGYGKSVVGKETKDFKETKVVASLNGPDPMCINPGEFNKNSSSCCKFPRNLFCVMKKKNLFKSLPFYVQFKLSKHYMNHYDVLFAQSNWIKQLFVNCGITPSKIKVIPNFFDPLFLKKMRTKETNQEFESTIVLYVGRIIEGKGVQDLTRTFNMLPNLDDLNLIIVGDGPLKEKLKIETKNNSSIKFTGEIPYEDILDYYVMSDIFVHPAREPDEALNRTLLEAGLSKNALLVSNVGSSPEVLPKNGLSFTGGDIKDLANKLKFLIEDEKYRKKMGGKVYEKVVNKFSYKQIIQGYCCPYLFNILSII